MSDEAENELLSAAREGSNAALGELLDGFRGYLLRLAHERLDRNLQAKLSASDVVQETFVEAQQGFEQFRGRTTGQFVAWLRQILLHNLSNEQRFYRGARKRQVALEEPIATDSTLGHGRLVDMRESTPSQNAVVNESEERLARAMTRLAPDEQQVILLRHREHCTFVEIAERMSLSKDAARRLWWRAFERLAEDLND